jgi:hypothetical protein
MFSEKSSATCYSGSCGLCTSCAGGGKTYVFPEAVTSSKESNELLKWGKTLLHQKRVRKQFNELKSIGIRGSRVDEKLKEERLKEEQRRNEELTKKRENTMRIADEYGEFEESDYEKRMKELVEETISGYKSGEDPIPAKYISFGRTIGVEMDGLYEVEEGYFYDADKFNRVDNLSNEEYHAYTEKFSIYKEKMDALIIQYGWKHQEDPGEIPLKVEHKGEQYTLIQDTICALCDDPECAMISHCCLEQDTFGGISDYYSGTPIYTHKKKHELCALCILK